MVKLALLVLAQILYSAAYIIYFTYSFEYERRLIGLHVCVLAVLISSGLMTAALASRLHHRLTRVAIAIVTVTGFGFLTSLYAANLVSSATWGGIVNAEIALRYAARPAVLLRYLLTVVDWRLVAFSGLAMTAPMIYLAQSRIIADGLTSMLDGTTRRRRLAVTAIAAMGIVPAFVAVALVYFTPTTERMALLRREPLVGFFIDSVAASPAFAVNRASNLPTGDSKRAAFDRRNVIVIVVDSLRADHLPIYGYQRPTTPFLERLRRSGKLTHVGLAMATCPESKCGVSSILASKTFDSLAPENFALHELFFRHGYQINFIVSGDHDWYGMREFYGTDLTVYFDGTMSRQYEPADDRVIFEGLDQVPQFKGTPAFFYIHLMSPHAIGYRQEQYQRFRPVAGSTAGRNLADFDPAALVNRYDNGVLQADAVLEQIFDRLDRMGYLDDALVVVSADHGEGLGEHDGMRGHAFQGSLYQEFLTIPLLIFEQRPAKYQNLRFATQVDIAPTIVSRVGLPVPPQWEGKSLLEPGLRAFTYHYLDVRGARLFAVMYPAGGTLYKYLRLPKHEQLFDLTTDPGERLDLITSADRALVERLRAELADAVAAVQR